MVAILKVTKAIHGLGCFLDGKFFQPIAVGITMVNIFL